MMISLPGLRVGALGEPPAVTQCVCHALLHAKSMHTLSMSGRSLLTHASGYV